MPATSSRRRPTKGKSKAAPRRTTHSSPAPRPILHLTSIQRNELWGWMCVGAGILCAAFLVAPSGGSIAAPVHNLLVYLCGVMAWGVSAALAIVGVRILWKGDARHDITFIVGCALVVIAAFGLGGTLGHGSCGAIGQGIATAATGPLGTVGGLVVFVILGLAGLIFSCEFRVRSVIEKMGATLQARRQAAVLDAKQAPVAPHHDDVKAHDLMGTAVPTAPGRSRKQRKTISGPVEGEDMTEFLPLPEPVEDVPPAFTREFEGFVAEPEAPTTPPLPVPGEGRGDDVADEKVWVIPTAELLDTVVGRRARLDQEIQHTGALICSTLQSFGIESRIIGANSGPTVTQFELQPARGVPVRRIMNYQTDLSLALAASIRIQPFIPGKSAIGIEVPNKAAQLVSIKEIIQSTPFADPNNRLSVVLGADVSGNPVVGDLARMPHLLIAGATGSGKSVCINAVLAGFLLQATPANLKMILIDPKRVELSGFADIPHLLVPVVVEPEAAVASLRWAVREMEERYKLFASHASRNIAAFNAKAASLGLRPLPSIVIVIDELADLMMVAAGEIEDLICRIAQLARAVGIHLVVATQRPSADIITGLIKANIPSRVAFAVSSGVDSRVILDEMGAEKLLGRGDMLYLPVDEGKPRRLQGAYVSDRELDAVIAYWKAQGIPDYQEEIFQVEATVSWAKEGTKRDPLFPKAAHLVAAEGRAAASLLQRKLSVGYTRAARLMDQLAEYGVVGPYEGSKSRDVLMDIMGVDELIAELGGEAPQHQGF